MEKHITEADFPITTEFIYTLSFLHVKDGSNAAGIRVQIQQSNAILWRTIFASLHLKDTSSRAVTVQTLLTYGHELNTLDIQSQMASLLDASFLSLDRSSQLTDLLQHWDMLSSQPDILPALKMIASVPAPIADDNLPSSIDGLYNPPLSGALVLRSSRPARTWRNSCREIGSTTPELSAQALSFLPPETTLRSLSPFGHRHSSNTQTDCKSACSARCSSALEPARPRPR